MRTRAPVRSAIALFVAAALTAASGCSYVQRKLDQVNALRSVMVPGHNYKTYSIPSDAMAPTITKGAFVIGDETAYQDGVPQRNDIVVLYPPISTNDPFVKRVVAVPGDTFELLDGKLIINGRPAPEPYLSEKTVYQMAVRDYNIYVDFGSGWRPLPTTTANMPSRSAWVKPDRIPNGYYITLGDNRNDSEDSHIWGFAQMAGRFSSGLNRGQNARSFVKVVKVLRAD